MDEMKTRFQLEERAEEDEEKDRTKKQSGSQSGSTDESDKKLDLERLDCKKVENEETLLVEEEKVVGGRRNLDKESSSDAAEAEWTESFEQLGPNLPLLKDPLPTGVACCLTRFSYFYSIFRADSEGSKTFPIFSVTRPS